LGGDLMDAVSLKLARNYTNEKLNSLPSNAPTKTVTFDGGIYSVGNDVVNGQVSASVKGRTLKNELNYNRDTWAEWEKFTGVQIVNGELEYTTHDSDNKIAVLPTKLKNNTTYGLLLNIPYSEITNKNMIFGNNLTGKYEIFFGPPYAIGNKKHIFTTTTIADNTLKLYMASVGSNGKVRIKDIRIFELPTGSEIENDFNTMTADQLAQKYPYINGDSTKSTNSVRVKSVGKNLWDGELELGIYDSITGIKAAYTGYMRSANKLIIKPSTSYKISSDDSSYKFFVYEWDANSNYIGRLDAGVRCEFTTSTTAHKIAIGTKSAGMSDLSTLIQLEEGTTATEYEPYKESSVIINLPEPLRSVPSVKDEVNVTGGIKTQRVGNKTNVASGTVINYTDMATAGQFEAWGSGEHVVGVKGDTLAFTATSLNYQLATPIVTKLPAQAPLQVFENGTVYVEPIGDASESTLPSVEMTIPTGTSNKFGVATHNYGGAAADWELTNSESKCFLLAVSNAGGSANIIAPNRPGTMYAISNASGYTITIKISGGNGVDVNTGKTVLVIHNGTDYTALTAEL
jgi:hypothetical protein